jgi:hypothetical protein
MEEFLGFKKMITPVLIQMLFWLGVLMCVIGGFAFMLRGGVGLFIGIGYIILGPVVVRVYCELLIVIFNIHDTLKELNSKVKDSLG